jgi:hypothetical protein
MGSGQSSTIALNWSLDKMSLSDALMKYQSFM